MSTISDLSLFNQPEANEGLLSLSADLILALFLESKVKDFPLFLLNE